MTDAATPKPTTPAPTSNRFMVNFGPKYAGTHDDIIQAAIADDRDPGEFVVRWLSAHFPSAK